MIRYRWRTAIVAAALALVGPPMVVAQEGQTLTEQGKLEQVIHDYLLAHPEVIVESLQRYQAQQDQAAATQQATALVDSREELTQAPDSPVLGNPDGNVAVVEFFDYQCPYCKLMASRKLIETLEEDRNVRIVMKEFPILGTESMYAAQAALSADRQGIAPRRCARSRSCAPRAPPIGTRNRQSSHSSSHAPRHCTAGRELDCRDKRPLVGLSTRSPCPTTGSQASNSSS